MSSTSQSSSVLTSSEAGLKPYTSEFRRQFRPQSTSKARDGKTKRNRLTTDTLNDLAQDPQRIPSFASSSIARSKSAKFFDEEFIDSKKESKKQAWAPKPKQNLSSSSTKFQRYGRIESIAELGGEGMMKGKLRGPKDFGRVCSWCSMSPNLILL